MFIIGTRVFFFFLMIPRFLTAKSRLNVFLTEEINKSREEIRKRNFSESEFLGSGMPATPVHSILNEKNFKNDEEIISEILILLFAGNEKGEWRSEKGEGGK